MHNRIGFNRLDRRPAHRKSLLRNMAISFFTYEKIKTTKAKALELRKVVEKIITRAKVDSVHNRREVAKKIHDKEVLNKLFKDIGVRCANRQGGYTRILKLGQRQGDAAHMVIFELVDKVQE